MTEETLREFFVRRTWLHGEGRMISDSEYQSLKDRDGRFWSEINPYRREYFHGFIDGWTAR